MIRDGKYVCQNGWTKAQIIKAIETANEGRISTLANSCTCAYRGEGGNACFVGAFIPDDVYDRVAEGMAVGILLNKYPGLLSYMPLPLPALIELQRVHDDCSGSNEKSLHEHARTWVEENVVDAAEVPK